MSYNTPFEMVNWESKIVCGSGWIYSEETSNGNGGGSAKEYFRESGRSQMKRI